MQRDGCPMLLPPPMVKLLREQKLETAAAFQTRASASGRLITPDASSAPPHLR